MLSSAVFPIVNLSVITFCVTERSEQFPLSGQTLGVMLLIYLINYRLTQLKSSSVKPYPGGKEKRRNIGMEKAFLLKKGKFSTQMPYS